MLVRTCFALGLAALALLPGCGAEQRAAPAAPQDASPVYRLSPDALPDDGCGDPSCTLVRYVVWVAPDPGWTRSESEDGTGFETTRLYAHGALVTDHGDGAPDVRSGLASFVGAPPESELVVAVRARGALSAGDRVRVRYGTATIEFVVREELDLASEAATALFALPEDGIRSTSLEPGEPSEAVAGYWLGPRYGDLDAVSAVERDAPAEDGYFVFYGAGPESADAFQIASANADEGSGLDLEGRSGRSVTLANGERARLVSLSPADGSYVVVTATTLIGFTAASEREAERITRALRPVERP